MEYLLVREGKEDHIDLEHIREKVGNGEYAPDLEVTRVKTGESFTLAELLDESDPDEEAHSLAAIARGDEADPSTDDHPHLHHHKAKAPLGPMIYLIIGIVALTGIAVGAAILLQQGGGSASGN